MFARQFLSRRLMAMSMNATATQGLPMAYSPMLSPMLMPRQQSIRLFSVESDSHDDFQPKSKVPQSSDDAKKEITEHISSWIADNDVCVFMKGSRKMPQCGFSRYVVVLLNAYGVKAYKDVNVLADDNLRSTIKEYSNWPTIPQIYIKGEFIGGCDIMKEMHEDGSLRELLIRESIIKE